MILLGWTRAGLRDRQRNKPAASSPGFLRLRGAGIFVVGLEEVRPLGGRVEPARITRLDLILGPLARRRLRAPGTHPRLCNALSNSLCVLAAGPCSWAAFIIVSHSRRNCSASAGVQPRRSNSGLFSLANSSWERARARLVRCRAYSRLAASGGAEALTQTPGAASLGRRPAYRHGRQLPPGVGAARLLGPLLRGRAAPLCIGLAATRAGRFGWPFCAALGGCGPLGSF